MAPRIQLNVPVLDLIEDLAIPALPHAHRAMNREMRLALIMARVQKRNS